MPSPIPVILSPHSREWAETARREAERLADALGGNLIAVHHIGSTAIPGIIAKPIVDLMPEVRSLSSLDHDRDRLGALGYQWWGEHGIPERRYLTLSDAETGVRRIQLHCFETGSPEIERHLAFRDFLRRFPEKAREYEEVKRQSRDRHPEDSHAYTEAKSTWIRATEAEALRFHRQGRR